MPNTIIEIKSESGETLVGSDGLNFCYKRRGQSVTQKIEGTYYLGETRAEISLEPGEAIFIRPSSIVKCDGFHKSGENIVYRFSSHRNNGNVTIDYFVFCTPDNNSGGGGPFVVKKENGETVFDSSYKYIHVTNYVTDFSWDNDYTVNNDGRAMAAMVTSIPAVGTAPGGIHVSAIRNNGGSISLTKEITSNGMETDSVANFLNKHSAVFVDVTGL